MKNAQFENDIADVPNLFNKLALKETNDGELYLKGNLDIVDKTGKLWESYQVEIKASEGYPYRFPKLFEIGGYFPKILDWHVYEHDDKSCCIDVPPNEMLLCKNGISVVDFIERFAIPYLANQKFRETEGYYLHGEYSHGLFGRIEFYQMKLKARKPAEFLKMLEYIIAGYNPNRTSYCPFCKKVKFRKCHRKAFKELEEIREFLLYEQSIFIPFFEAYPEYIMPSVNNGHA